MIVDDDAAFLRALSRSLREYCEQIIAVGTYEDAMMCTVAAPAPECSIIDIHLEDRSGVELIAALRLRLKNMRIVAVSGDCSVPTVVAAMRSGASDYLVKPFDAVDLLTTLCGPPQDPNLCMRGTHTLERMKRTYIDHVLAESGGVVSEAARRLGIRRTSLQRMLKK